jgi:ketosteroid isomerase-like protein
MKQGLMHITILASAIFLTACAVAQNPAGKPAAAGSPAAIDQSTASVEQEISQLERAWVTAESKSDFSAMERMLADDVIIQTASGFKTKAEYLAGVKSDAEQDKRTGLKITATVDEVKVKALGDTYLCYGYSASIDEKNGKTETFKLAFTDVVAKRQGRWQFVSMAGSVMREKGRAIPAASTN